MTPRKLYLSDGVYVEWDGFAFVLTAGNGDRVTNRIVLEPDVFHALVGYARRVGLSEREHEDLGLLGS